MILSQSATLSSRHERKTCRVSRDRSPKLPGTIKLFWIVSLSRGIPLVTGCPRVHPIHPHIIFPSINFLLKYLLSNIFNPVIIMSRMLSILTQGKDHQKAKGQVQPRTPRYPITVPGSPKVRRNKAHNYTVTQVQLC